LASAGSRGALLDRWKREIARGSAWDERAFANGLAALSGRLPESHLAG
jgi:hypothetical protein